jgi:hypothetical protein
MTERSFMAIRPEDLELRGIWPVKTDEGNVYLDSCALTKLNVMLPVEVNR